MMTFLHSMGIDIWSNHNNLLRLLLKLKWHQTINKNSEVSVLEDNITREIRTIKHMVLLGTVTKQTGKMERNFKILR